MKDVHTSGETGTIDALVGRQRAFFLSGATLDVAFRLERLAALRETLRAHEREIFTALDADLRKSTFETYTSEIGVLYDEIKFTRKHLRRWMRPRRVSTPIIHVPASSRIIYRPYGVSAIFAPWNYPIQLSLAPLIGAIAAGNCAIIKPSELAPKSSEVIGDLIDRSFDPCHIAVVQGESRVAAELGAAEIDHIFFTGSTAVGKIVMRSAAERLIPATLELGGKSPAIVAADAKIELAARRIAWGTFLNAGQTCVAPDFVLVHEAVHDRFAAAFREAVRTMYGDEVAKSPDFGRIVDDRHFLRLVDLIERERVSGAVPLFGGTSDRATRFIAPTAFTGCSWDGPLMEDEIFGPVVPILPFPSLDDAIARLNTRSHPLAAYLFTENRATIRKFEREVVFGGATINDSIVHLVNPNLPFGGLGPSGIGSYHGYAGFRAFSHETAILRRGTLFDLPLRYPPYGNALKLVRHLMRP